MKIKLIIYLTFIATIINGQTIQYSYDNLGRLTQVIYPDSSELKTTYDKVSNRIATIVFDPCSLKPRPIITASDSTTICSGDSIYLTASYGLDFAWSSGDTGQTILVTNPGSYTVTVTVNEVGCEVTSLPYNVDIVGLPFPEITLEGDSSFCEGNSTTLIATEAESYIWSTGATTQNITITEAGIYNVNIIDSNGCTGTSNNLFIDVFPLPELYSITCDELDLAICQGENVTFEVDYDGVSSLQWQKDGINITGAINNIFLATQKGNYSCLVFNPCGSVSSPSIFLNVTKGPTANITASGPTTFCAGGSVVLNATIGAGLSYQWYKNNTPIAGATAFFYTATTAGTYKCNVTKISSGCNKFTKNIKVIINCREGEATNSEGISLFPNPTSSTINVAMFFEGSKLIQLVDITGNVIYTKTTENTTLEIDVANLSAGVYFIIVENNDNLMYEQFVKQ